MSASGLTGHAPSYGAQWVTVRPHPRPVLDPSDDPGVVRRIESVRPVRTHGTWPTPLGWAVVVGTVLAGRALWIAADPVLTATVALTGACCLIVGIVTAVVAARRTSVRAEAITTDPAVGDDVTVRLSTDRPAVEVRLLDPTGDWVTTGTRPVEASRLAARRGWFPTVRVQVRSTGWLGLFASSRFVMARLPRPIHVRPVDIVAVEPTPRSTQPGRDAGAAATAPGVESVRSVRPYVPGDPAHLVHWPTSARAGALVVRELEPPTRRQVALVVDLTHHWPDAEVVVALAQAVGRAELAVGTEVFLASHERGAPVGRSVGTALELGRRLAGAGPGPVGSTPIGWPLRDAAREWEARRADDHPVGHGGPVP